MSKCFPQGIRYRNRPKKKSKFCEKLDTNLRKAKIIAYKKIKIGRKVKYHLPFLRAIGRLKLLSLDGDNGSSDSEGDGGDCELEGSLLNFFPLYNFSGLFVFYFSSRSTTKGIKSCCFYLNTLTSNFL